MEWDPVAMGGGGGVLSMRSLYGWDVEKAVADVQPCYSRTQTLLARTGGRELGNKAIGMCFGPMSNF